MLAPILSPNPILCDQKFELVMDNNTYFVGHPVSLPSGVQKRQINSSTDLDNSSDLNDAKTQQHEPKHDEIRLFHLCFVLSKDHSNTVKIRNSINQFYRVSSKCKSTL